MSELDLEVPTASLNPPAETLVADLLCASLGLCFSSFALVALEETLLLSSVLLLLFTFLWFGVSEAWVSLDLLLDRLLATFAGVGALLDFLGDQDV